MFRHLFCLSLLFFGSLAAESIDNIEFQLPAQQGWRVEEEIVNSLGMAQIYLPENDPFVDTFELFSAQLFHVPFVNDKPEEFGQWMQIAFPFFALHCNLVETSEDSTTMEIFGFEDGQLELYSLFRRIRSDNGTVLLSYSTDKGLEAEENRNLWIQTLLNAKPVAN
ncbi:MAG: hypothetical protein JSR39_06600 [Verrucomicrobia bacterium]|nr:hypothetical protein [Verrucomicrobiota bacterium]